MQPRLKQALGAEINATLVALSQRRVSEEQLKHQVEILNADWVTMDMAGVDAVVLFFLSHHDVSAMLQRKLRANMRVV
ncbi:hypothetical protein PybrP1_007712, partial [[Pythium] brassicae (nom. inval.)]